MSTIPNPNPSTSAPPQDGTPQARPRRRHTHPPRTGITEPPTHNAMHSEMLQRYLSEPDQLTGRLIAAGSDTADAGASQRDFDTLAARLDEMVRRATDGGI
ncbi:hypothetical protein S40293_10458 [Stachybotrys chartarum IBT 40293]|nr:hypothetical protein S40293_10458 [Stachybotrys chartarum IBT 40293]